MKLIKIFSFLFVIFLFPHCSTVNKQNDSPLKLIWEMNANSVEKRTYENTFYLVNLTKESIDDNWVIYFNQNHAAVASSDLNLKVEQISGSYYKVYPGEQYQPIASNDTVKFTFRCRGSIIKTSHHPEGVYIVFKDSDGNELTPITVPVEVVPFTREEQFLRSDVDEIPYPYGETLYEENASFQAESLCPTDIFPSLKAVNYKKGEFKFSSDVFVQLNADEFSQEVDFLKDKLKQQLHCRFTEKAKTKIIVIKSETAFYTQPESYTIDFTDNQVIINAATRAGVFNAIQTLLNILGFEKLPFSMPNTFVEDYPDLLHRGFMLDIARNYTPKDKILRLIEILSSYKLNVLHLHLTDDEAWRIEIPGLEELTAIGSKRGHTLDEQTCLYPAYGGGWNAEDKLTTANGYLTKSDFIEILQYAAKHHMKVIPEIDMPGHSRAAIKAMEARYSKYIDDNPDMAAEFLLSDFNDESKYRSAQSYTDNTICVALPSAYNFIEKVVTEVVQMYEEAGLVLDIFHIGGDEVAKGTWTASKICLDFMQKHNMQETRELKDYFISKVLEIFQNNNLQMAGWQELALLPDNSTNPLFADANLLSYCWSTLPSRNRDQIPYQLANAGYPIILSNVTNLYFDLSNNKHEDEPGAYWGGFVDEISSFDMLPYNTYKAVRKDLKGEARDLQKDYLEKEQLNETAKPQIKGVQAQLWAETIRSYDMVEYYIFPKLFGLVDRAWNATPTWNDKNDDSAYQSDLALYKSKIYFRELERLSKQKINFRLAQPGIKIMDDMLYANSVYPDAAIRFTVDGSEPNAHSELWTKPVKCLSKNVKAKVFYMDKESVATRLRY